MTERKLGGRITLVSAQLGAGENNEVAVALCISRSIYSKTIGEDGVLRRQPRPHVGHDNAFAGFRRRVAGSGDEESGEHDEGRSEKKRAHGSVRGYCGDRSGYADLAHDSSPRIPIQRGITCELTCGWALQRERFPELPTVCRASGVAERTNTTRQVQRWVIPRTSHRWLSFEYFHSALSSSRTVRPCFCERLRQNWTYFHQRAKL